MVMCPKWLVVTIDSTLCDYIVGMYCFHLKEDYSDKVDFELMDKIRVVSAQSFSFPIWVVGNLVVPVRVGESSSS